MKSWMKLFGSIPFKEIYGALLFFTVLIFVFNIQTKEFTTNVSRILEKHGQENNSLIKKWEAKQSFTTEDVKELVNEFHELGTRQQKELEELLDAIKIKEKEE